MPKEAGRNRYKQGPIIMGNLPHFVLAAVSGRENGVGGGTCRMWPSLKSVLSFVLHPDAGFQNITV
ncbi:hypothetical protein NC651_000008 [Populus alba x Populus x berolinensis]|nr:hypothetical protein NC651_000008 [Populus alba x Populus x berolinensis]